MLAGGPLGIMEACLDVVVPYVHERKQFGQPIGEFQLMQGKLADMYVDDERLRAPTSMRWPRACDRGQTTRKDAAGCILYAAEKATLMALEAIQALGGNGYINDYPTGRLLRDAKLYEIGAGTSEIRRMLIGRELFAGDGVSPAYCDPSISSRNSRQPSPPTVTAMHAQAERTASSSVARCRRGRRREGARARIIARGKLLPRDRVDARCSIPARRSSRFGRSPAHGMYDGDAPAAGMITGIGRVAGRECMIVAQRRHRQGRHLLSDDGEEAPAGAGDRRARTSCPASTWSIPAARSCRCRTRCFPTASISAASSTTRRSMSAAGIPQIAVVMGSCTAGGAYVPAMSRRDDHRRRAGHDLPRRPAAGEGRDRRESSAPKTSAAATCIRACRASPTIWRATTRMRWRSRAGSSRTSTRVKRVDVELQRARSAAATIPRSCYGIVPADPRKPYDVREVIARIVDGSRFDEFKARYGTTLVCGFAHIHGYPGRHRRQQRRAVLRDRR